MAVALDAGRARRVGGAALLLLILALPGCPARKQAVRHPASPAARVRPRPCAELKALLVEGRPPRALVLQLTGRGTGACEVRLEDLKLQYRPTSSTLAKVKLPRRLAPQRVDPNKSKTLRLAVRLLSDPPNCRVTLTGTQIQEDHGQSRLSVFRAPISQGVACGAEVAR